MASEIAAHEAGRAAVLVEQIELSRRQSELFRAAAWAVEDPVVKTNFEIQASLLERNIELLSARVRQLGGTLPPLPSSIVSEVASGSATVATPDMVGIAERIMRMGTRLRALGQVNPLRVTIQWGGERLRSINWEAVGQTTNPIVRQILVSSGLMGISTYGMYRITNAENHAGHPDFPGNAQNFVDRWVQALRLSDPTIYHMRAEIMDAVARAAVEGRSQRDGAPQLVPSALPFSEFLERFRAALSARRPPIFAVSLAVSMGLRPFSAALRASSRYIRTALNMTSDGVHFVVTNSVNRAGTAVERADAAATWAFGTPVLNFRNYFLAREAAMIERNGGRPVPLPAGMRTNAIIDVDPPAVPANCGSAAGCSDAGVQVSSNPAETGLPDVPSGLDAVMSGPSPQEITGAKASNELFRFVNEALFSFRPEASASFLRIRIFQSSRGVPVRFGMEKCFTRETAPYQRESVENFCRQWREHEVTRTMWPRAAEAEYAAMCDPAGVAQLRAGFRTTGLSPYFWQYYEYSCSNVTQFTRAELPALRQGATDEDRLRVVDPMIAAISHSASDLQRRGVVSRVLQYALISYATDFARLVTELHTPSMWQNFIRSMSPTPATGPLPPNYWQ